MKTIKNFFNTVVEKMSFKIAILATLNFIFWLWLIDYSPIGVAGLLKVTNGVSILDFETRYSASFAYDWLTSMGEAGRAFHLFKIMPLDIFYPASFMLLQFCWMGYFLKKITKSESIFRLLPILAIIYMLLDWTENIGITAMLINFPNELPVVAVTTGIITSVKLTVVATSLGVIGLTVLLTIIRLFVKKRITR